MNFLGTVKKCINKCKRVDVNTAKHERPLKRNRRLQKNCGEFIDTMPERRISHQVAKYKPNGKRC